MLLHATTNQWFCSKYMLLDDFVRVIVPIYSAGVCRKCHIPLFELIVLNVKRDIINILDAYATAINNLCKRPR